EIDPQVGLQRAAAAATARADSDILDRVIPALELPMEISGVIGIFQVMLLQVCPIRRLDINADLLQDVVVEEVFEGLGYRRKSQRQQRDTCSQAVAYLRAHNFCLQRKTEQAIKAQVGPEFKIPG